MITKLNDAVSRQALNDAAKTSLMLWANVSIALKTVRDRRYERIELPLLIAWIQQFYDVDAAMAAGISRAPVEDVVTPVSRHNPPAPPSRPVGDSLPGLRLNYPDR